MSFAQDPTLNVPNRCWKVFSWIYNDPPRDVLLGVSISGLFLQAREVAAGAISSTATYCPRERSDSKQNHSYVEGYVSGWETGLSAHTTSVGRLTLFLVTVSNGWSTRFLKIEASLISA